jgi:hypothetical protein
MDQRKTAAISAGAATIEFDNPVQLPRHAIAVKVLDSNGDEATPTSGAAAIDVKMHADDAYEDLIGDADTAVSIDLENGPWIYAFELPVAAVKITGSNLGSNATLVATMMSWR